MKFHKSRIIQIVFFLVLFTCSYTKTNAQEAHRYQRVYLSGEEAARAVDWDFMVTDGRRAGEWAKIAVPSNWELQGFGTYNYGHDWKDEKIKLGKEKGMYRYQFEVPDSWKGKAINIVFEGSMTDTEVKVNGKLAGEIHQGAFYQFKYDIGKLLKYGASNLLEVTVSKHSANESVNRAERQADFWIFGGIFRPVYLEVLPEVHFERIAIDARANGGFIAHVELNKLAKKASVEVELFDAQGQKSLGKFQQDIQGKTTLAQGSFSDIEQWNPEAPNLYRARVSLLQNGQVVYQKDETIGFRTVELRPNDGFYVNGQRAIFKGVNRHSFYPETGRALSDGNHMEDLLLMKEMNMNAVRMSHYPPDERFLDLCDSLGMFVLNEVTGWQDGYDTIVGPKLVKETVIKHANHPSVVIWDHGNEGGWTFANERGFHEYDIQKRPVIYPWLQRNKVDTYHYLNHNEGINRYSNGADVYMPTEFLHGLYDGGHGAGLEDYWNDFMKSPLVAGGFLWVFSDEAVVRTDKDNILDADGNHAPDGIVGPYREMEGSFYTIKNIWSPIQVSPVTVSKHFDGGLFLENKYIYTNLDQCAFQWQAIKMNGLDNATVMASGVLDAPDIAPGEMRRVDIDLPEGFGSADILSMTATDPHGMEIYTWTWPVKMPEAFAKETLGNLPAKGKITVREEGRLLKASVDGLSITINLENGMLEEVTNANGKISLNGGPLPVGLETKMTGAEWRMDADGHLIVEVQYDPYPRYVRWKLETTGMLHLEVAPLWLRMQNVDFVGVSFNYPEELVEGIRWIGNGPYRVWKNRMKGAEMGLWEKAYNNTITGYSVEPLVYPEFKGYHAGLYAMELQNKESNFRIYTETPNLFFRLYTPENSPFATPGVIVPFPEGDLSFLLHIPPIGTKFRMPENMGPGSQKGRTNFHKGDEGYPISLWFDFRL